LDLFTPQTWQGFIASGSTVSGFREHQRTRAERNIQIGDIFVCYLVKLSRWCGILEVKSNFFIDDTPIFFQDSDPFIIRFEVKPIITLKMEESVPIQETWQNLSFTKGVEVGSFGWAQSVGLRSSLKELSKNDATQIIETVSQQSNDPKPYPFTSRELATAKPQAFVRTEQGGVAVEVPEREVEESSFQTLDDQSEGGRISHQMQARVASIGIAMGFNIWIPAGDKGRVIDLMDQKLHDHISNKLPLNYDDTTLQTIENIDVIWLKGRSMVRAFEVEHTTAIYSGLLRMADLLALQPNMQIALHIVAGADKREKVRKEIIRPVFSLLDSGAMYTRCSFLAYEAINTLIDQPHLSHTNHTILEEFEEFFEP